MEKEEFDKSLTKLVNTMNKMKYSRYSREQTLLWLLATPEERLLNAIRHIQEKLDTNPNEENFELWISEYGDKIRKKPTEEEKKKILEEIRKRRNNKK